MEKKLLKKGSYEIPCKICNENIVIDVPEMEIGEDETYPLTFNYMHKNKEGFTHSITLYIDAQMKVRGYDTDRFVGISKEILKDISEAYQLKADKLPKKILQMMLVGLGNMIEPYMPNSREFLEKYGYFCGESFAEMINGNSIDEILNEIAEFWKFMEFGDIQDIHLQIDEDNGQIDLKFKIYQCFECSYMKNIGKMYCSLDTGIIKGLLETKLKMPLNVMEIACYANGNECCEFVLRSLNFGNSWTVSKLRKIREGN